MNFNSLGIESSMLAQDSQKLFWLHNFSSKHVSVGVRKNISAELFIDTQKLLSGNTLRANVYIFLYISVRTFLLQRQSKVLCGGGWVWGRLNNFFKSALMQIWKSSYIFVLRQKQFLILRIFELFTFEVCKLKLG